MPVFKCGICKDEQQFKIIDRGITKKAHKEYFKIQCLKCKNNKTIYPKK